MGWLESLGEEPGLARRLQADQDHHLEPGRARHRLSLPGIDGGCQRRAGRGREIDPGCMPPAKPLSSRNRGPVEDLLPVLVDGWRRGLARAKVVADTIMREHTLG